MDHTAIAAKPITTRKPPAPLFRCSLDEHPPALLPIRAAAAWKKRRVSRELLLNRACFLTAPELRSLPFLDRFASPNDVVWVLDQEADALKPFWLSPNLRPRLASLSPGAPPPHDLPDEILKSLELAGVLVTKDHEARRNEQLRRTQESCSAHFRAHRYVVLQDLLHPIHLAGLRRYVRELVASGSFQVGTGGYEHCDLVHNEPVTRFFHHQLTSTVSRVVGQPVQPSYSFVISYRGGSALRRHIDRQQCEFTLTLALDFVPEPEGATPWPLYVETASGIVLVEQSLGDALLFCGRELPHYRRKLANGYVSTALLLHFVPRNFNGRLD